jgi:hypothetical protein
VTEAARPETWDDLLAGHRPEVQASGRAMLGAILEALPDAVVQYDRGDRLLAIGTGGRMRDLVFALVPHARWLNLQLVDGALLPDPDRLIEGTGKRIRHVKIRSADQALSPAVRSIVRAQVAVRST